MSLANMRENGVRSLWVRCIDCKREVSVLADMLPDETYVPEAAKRFRCSSCGSNRVETRPDWSTQNPRPSGAG